MSGAGGFFVDYCCNKLTKATGGAHLCMMGSNITKKFTYCS